MVKRFHAIIQGRVQGVFFRATAREHAKALGLQGFAKNLPDRSVELDAQGDEESLRDLLNWCQHGPPGARVDHVEVTWKPPQASIREDFQVQ